jgi:hypothetical protein
MTITYIPVSNSNSSSENYQRTNKNTNYFLICLTSLFFIFLLINYLYITFVHIFIDYCRKNIIKKKKHKIPGLKFNLIRSNILICYSINLGKIVLLKILEIFLLFLELGFFPIFFSVIIFVHLTN